MKKNIITFTLLILSFVLINTAVMAEKQSIKTIKKITLPKDIAAIKIIQDKENFIKMSVEESPKCLIKTYLTLQNKCQKLLQSKTTKVFCYNQTLYIRCLNKETFKAFEDKLAFVKS